MKPKFPPPATIKPFMTHIPDRRPPSKLHGNLGQAKAAVGIRFGAHGARGGQIWEWVAEANDWRLMWTVRPGTAPEDLPWDNVAARRAKQPPVVGPWGSDGHGHAVHLPSYRLGADAIRDRLLTLVGEDGTLDQNVIANITIP